jgi:hypothetical protein
MQTKFDPTKNHGVIYNHPAAMFEQNGILYDGVGEPIEQAKPKSTTPYKQPVAKTKIAKNVTPEDFLSDILDGGPVTQANVKKESELRKLDWSDIQMAAITMNIEKFKKGSTNMWKLAEEQA